MIILHGNKIIGSELKIRTKQKPFAIHGECNTPAMFLILKNAQIPVQTDPIPSSNQTHIYGR